MAASNSQSLLLLPHRLFGNIYLRELGRAYQDKGIRVVYGPENLFESSLQTDLIHLHWPEEQYRGYLEGPVSDNINRLFDRLDQYKANGGRLIWTVHNLAPHEFPDSDLDQQAYQGIIDRADVILHHCQRSAALLAERYQIGPAMRSIVSPHGHYLAYPNTISQSEAREKLGIDQNAVVFLHFGAVRGYKGLDIVFRSFHRARVKRKVLVVAGRYQREPNWRGRLENVRISLLEKFGRKMHIHPTAVDYDQVQLYLNACNALVLGHRRGLNSGVAVLGITFGKLVIGPAIGCIDGLLRQGRNCVYPAGDCDALALAMEAVPNLDMAHVAEANLKLAKSWRWSNMASTVIDALSDDL